MDNPVIKDLEGYPYIPGSSLKGKLRFLLERKYGEDNEIINNLFGRSAGEKNPDKITILLVRDFFVDRDTKEKIDEKKNYGESYLEEKYEVAIKNQSKSQPRPIERVPVNYIFEGNLVLRFYNQEDEEKENEYIELLKEGLELLKNDYLGGSGSRGYGKVDIEIIEN